MPRLNGAAARTLSRLAHLGMQPCTAVQPSHITNSQTYKQTTHHPAHHPTARLRCSRAARLIPALDGRPGTALCLLGPAPAALWALEGSWTSVKWQQGATMSPRQDLSRDLLQQLPQLQQHCGQCGRVGRFTRANRPPAPALAALHKAQSHSRGTSTAAAEQSRAGGGGSSGGSICCPTGTQQLQPQ